MKTRLSKKEAARLALHSQGLLKKNPFGKGKGGVLRALDQLGYVQIDTISVIERTHNHTFWTRLPNFNPEVLDELQVKDRKIFEYWSHAEAYLPLADYRFYLYKMRAIAAGEKHWHAPDKKMMKRVLNRFRGEGPLMARDFKPPEDHQAAPWWNWKPAKRALEHLYDCGRLTIAGRVGFQRIYDLPERVLPAQTDKAEPGLEESYRYLLEQSMISLGVCKPMQVCDYIHMKRTVARPFIEEMVDNGTFVEFQGRLLDGEVGTLVVHRDRLSELEPAADG
ncbi:YcaQ family DNA glycosylase, partial [candidate division KSB1 bacterium]|nr:YcaQ family DNA glycosylase [candidate division KSB1 bacterium]